MRSGEGHTQAWRCPCSCPALLHTSHRLSGDFEVLEEALIDQEASPSSRATGPVVTAWWGRRARGRSEHGAAQARA